MASRTCLTRITNWGKQARHQMYQTNVAGIAWAAGTDAAAAAAAAAALVATADAATAEALAGGVAFAPSHAATAVRLECQSAYRAEKNWIGFVHGGTLHYVTSVEPHTIATVGADGACLVDR